MATARHLTVRGNYIRYAEKYSTATDSITTCKHDDGQLYRNM
jgi:uncharacterized beta-barrel protein YwiB (DUF1934 family)